MGRKGGLTSLKRFSLVTAKQSATVLVDLKPTQRDRYVSRGQVSSDSSCLFVMLSLCIRPLSGTDPLTPPEKHTGKGEECTQHDRASEGQQ